MNKKHSKHITITIFLIAVFSRLLPHAPNFTPLESIALFGGAFFISRFRKIFLPLVAIYITDFILNNTLLRVYFAEQEGVIWFSEYMIWNALAILGIIVIGNILSKKVNLISIGVSAIAASLLFFIISNIGVWFSSPIYTKDIQGIVNCFIAALPFFRSSLISTVAFSYVLIGGYYWIMYKKPELA